jgi:hypothetical protein
MNMMRNRTVAVRRLEWGHPASWAVPVMVLLVTFARPLNSMFYDIAVNYDPQGDAQLHEASRTTSIFRYTSGLLFGQLLALIVGVVLARRHRHAVAFAVAVPLGALLAAAAFVVWTLLDSVGSGGSGYAPLGDPVVRSVLALELAAYPLFAVVGVGLGVLWHGVAGHVGLTALVIAFWLVGTLIGLFQDDGGDAPHWLYWAMPPVGAATAITLTGMSGVDETAGTAAGGDWGREASRALVAGVMVYAVGVNTFVLLRNGWRARRRAAGG